jgi:hypothetical protein
MVWSPLLQGHVVFSIILNGWRKALVFSCAVTIAVKFGFTFIFSLTLLCTFGKNCFAMAAFVQFSHLFFLFCTASSSISLYNVLFGILLKQTVAFPLHAAAFAS